MNTARPQHRPSNRSRPGEAAALRNFQRTYVCFGSLATEALEARVVECLLRPESGRKADRLAKSAWCQKRTSADYSTSRTTANGRCASKPCSSANPPHCSYRVAACAQFGFFPSPCSSPACSPFRAPPRPTPAPALSTLASRLRLTPSSKLDKRTPTDGDAPVG